MRFFVTVKTQAREETVESIDSTHLKISVKAPPIEGRATAAVSRVLARFLGVPLSALRLRSGATGKKKVFEVAEGNKSLKV